MPHKKEASLGVWQGMIHLELLATAIAGRTNVFVNNINIILPKFPLAYLPNVFLVDLILDSCVDWKRYLYLKFEPNFEIAFHTVNYGIQGNGP